jgi:hypothetical protein
MCRRAGWRHAPEAECRLQGKAHHMGTINRQKTHRARYAERSRARNSPIGTPRISGSSNSGNLIRVQMRLAQTQQRLSATESCTCGSEKRARTAQTRQTSIGDMCVPVPFDQLDQLAEGEQRGSSSGSDAHITNTRAKGTFAHKTRTQWNSMHTQHHASLHEESRQHLCGRRLADPIYDKRRRAGAQIVHSSLRSTAVNDVANARDGH